jgi:two-component system probable response regulator PhcQ
MTTGYDYKKYAVLYVDDEEISLKYFSKAMETDFRVLTVVGVSEALQILEEQGDEVGVLVTDQRMPGRLGTDLLAEVRGSWPNIVRILTTAYADLDSAIEAVNSGAIFQYVTKPWNIREFRGLLLRAMDFFLVQQERDLLLREKLSVLQRMMITDRVRSLSSLAGGLAHHIRNSTTALQTFLDLAPVKSPSDPAEGDMFGKEFRDDLWTMARKESDRILQIVQQVADTTVEPTPQFEQVVSLVDLVSLGVDAARKNPEAQGWEVVQDIDAALPPFKVDAPMAQRLFQLLILRMVRLRGEEGTIALRARDRVPVWGTPGVRIVISDDGPAWSDDLIASFFTLFAPEEGDPQALGLDLLSAFCIAHHHGGDIVVHKARPDGPGFEVQLPFDPEAAERPSLEENTLEKLFTRFESWDSQREEG